MTNTCTVGSPEHMKWQNLEGRYRSLNNLINSSTYRQGLEQHAANFKTTVEALDKAYQDKLKEIETRVTKARKNCAPEAYYAIKQLETRAVIIQGIEKAEKEEVPSYMLDSARGGLSDIEPPHYSLPTLPKGVIHRDR